MSLSAWYVAGGALLLLVVLLGGAWLITVIVRRSNEKVVDRDTEPFDVKPSAQQRSDPPPQAE